MIQTICGNASTMSRRRSSLTFLKPASFPPALGFPGSGGRAGAGTARHGIPHHPPPRTSRQQARKQGRHQAPDGNGLKREDGTRNRRSRDGTGGYDGPLSGQRW